MFRVTVPRPAASAAGVFPVLMASFERHLLAENKAPRTVGMLYLDAVRRLGDFLAAKGMSTDVEAIMREHVESFIADLLARCKPATASNRFRAPQAFFKWLLEEPSAFGLGRPIG